MATRKKHLINVHTSTGTTAPTAADLRLGEIAVQHTSENPALWIKMGNTESSAVYEKFIGSTEITNMLEDSKILGSGYTYSGIPYVNSSTTLADAYSALTREMIDDEKVVAAALNDLNGRVIEISGNTPDMTNYYDKGEVEHIISVSGGTDVSPLSGAVMSLSAGTIALVGSSAASVFSSAKTYTDSEIGKLDSTGHTSDSGHYLTSVTITDGIITAVGEKPVPGETDITTATSGNGNVISNLTATGHQITMVKGVTAATSAQVSTLSAATHAHIANGNIHVTGAQKTAWTNGANSGASAYTGVTQLSGAVGSLEDEVAKIAVTAVTVSGTGNAVVAATYSDNSLTLGKGNVQAVITDLAAIRSNAASGMQAYNDVRSVSAATAGISQTLNTVSGAAHNKITALSAATTGISQGLSNLSAATLSAVTAKGDNYIDASVASRSAITVTTKKPVVTDLSAAISGTGSLADARAIKTYIDNTLSSTVTYKGATASLPSNPAVGDMWVAASAFTAGGQSVEVGDFVIARTSGTSAQWDVIEKNLDGAVTGALTADTVTLGESTNSVKSLANGSNGTVLAISGNKPVWTSAVKVSSASVADNALKVNNHTVSTDVPTGAVFTDTATTEGGHYTPGTSASTEGSATGFIRQIRLDSKKHVVGIVSGSVSDTATTEAGHYTPSTSASTKGTTAATTTSFVKGIRVDSKSHVIDVVTGAVVTAETQLSYNSGSSVSNTASAVMTGLTVSNHAVTYGKTNKIFSASTSDSATTTKSATTAGSAVSATTSQSASTAAALTGNITTGQVTDLAATIKSTTVNSATTATSAKTSSSAVTATNAVTSQSAATAAALTGNITTGQVTNLTTKIQTTKVNSATTADSAANATHAAAATKVDSALTINILNTTGGTASTVTFNGSANKTVNVPANTDTATTETGHYTPGTSASTEGSTTGFIQQIRLDSKKHVVGIVSGTTSYTETAVTTKNGTTGSTAAPVLSSITTGGTKGHELTLNYTNKVNSATTANSAVTATNAVSATTSLSAKSADDSAKLGGVVAANYATTTNLNALSSATHTHVTNGEIHVTGAQKTAWTNGANSGASAYTMVQNLSAVTLTGVTAGGTAVPVSNKVAAIPSASTSAFGVVKTGDFLTNTNGTIKVATGTTSSTVARGDHAHSGYATTTNLNALSAATTAHTADTTAHVTDEDKTLWNAAITGVTSAGTGNAFTEYEIAGNLLTLKKGATYLTTAATTTQGGRADSALQYVCGSTYVAVSAKSGANGAKIQTISAKTKGVEASTATGQGLADAYDVKQYVDGIVSSTVAYKGATATLPTASTVGDMYIATAQIPLTAAQSATGAAQTAETGDFIIARATGKWDVIQKNLDGAITGNLTADTVTLGDGTHSAKSLANGAEGQVLVISSNKPAWADAQLTDTATTKDGHYNPGFTGTSAGTAAANGFTKAVLLDGKGHVTGTTTGTAITAETKVSVTTNAAGNTAAAVVSGIASGGTLGHTLTVSKTNKIFSASTSDSATTAKSATTAENSVSAATATSAKTSSSAVTTTSAVTSQSANTAADSAKLGGVAAANYSQTSHTHSQYVNQNAFGNIAVGSTTGTATAVTDTLTFSGAGATTVSIDATNRKITISSTDNDTKVTAVGNHYTATTATKTGGTTTATAASAVKGITYDNAGHIVGVTTGSVLTGETSVSVANGTTGNTAAAVITGITTGGTAGHALTLNKSNKVFSATTANSAVTATNAVSATTSLSAKSADNSAKLGGVAAANYSLTSHTHDEYATTATLNALSAATDTHVGDSDIHVTAQQKGGWDAKQDAITDLAQIRNNALSGASAYTRVQELSASVIANRDAISALTDSLDELSGAVWSKEFVIAMGMNDLRDKIREISGSTGLPDVTAADDGKILRVQSGTWALVDPTVIYTGSGTPASTLGNEGDIYFQI